MEIWIWRRGRKEVRIRRDACIRGTSEEGRRSRGHGHDNDSSSEQTDISTKYQVYLCTPYTISIQIGHGCLCHGTQSANQTRNRNHRGLGVNLCDLPAVPAHRTCGPVHRVTIRTKRRPVTGSSERYHPLHIERCIG